MKAINKAIMTLLIAIAISTQLPNLQSRMGDYAEVDIKVLDARIEGGTLYADVKVMITNIVDFDFKVADCIVKIYWDERHSQLADTVDIGALNIDAGETETLVKSLELRGYDGQDYVYLTIDASINKFPYHAEQKVRIGI